MTALQVRDCPEDVYEGLRQAAARDGRSLSQEAVFVLRAALGRGSSPHVPAEPPREGTASPCASDVLARGRALASVDCLAYESPSARDERLERRKLTIEGLRSLPVFELPEGFPSPESIVREARDAR